MLFSPDGTEGLENKLRIYRFFGEKHLDLSPWHKDFHQFFYYDTLNSIMQTILFTIFHFFHSLLFDIKSNGMMTVP